MKDLGTIANINEGEAIEPCTALSDLESLLVLGAC